MTDQPDLFTTPTAGAGPATGPEEPEKGYYSTGERYYPDGRKRPTFIMPVLKPAQPRNIGAEYDEMERRAQAADDRRKGGNKPRGFEGSRQMAERIEAEQRGEEKTGQKEQDA